MSELAVARQPRGAGPGALREQIESMIEIGLSASRLAVEAGLQSRDLDAWREGRGSQDTEAKLAAWLAERDSETTQGGPGFVDTPTTRRIFAALQTAQRDPCIALIYGGAGVGKTAAAKHYVETKNSESAKLGDASRVYYIVAGPAASKPTGVLEILAQAMGSYGGAFRLRALFEDISRRLRQGDLLIIDEAQYLGLDSLDLLRGFVPDGDDFGVGIAYLGNEEFFSRLHGVGQAARFAQITSRVGARVHVGAPAEGDVDALLAAWGVAGRKERQFAVQIGTMPGGLRVLGRVLKNSRKFAQRVGKPVDVKTLKSVARYTGDWRG